MDAYSAHQQDEGYSEDPLNQSVATSSRPSIKSRYDNGDSVITPDSSASEVPLWLIQHIAQLSDEEKSGEYP